MLRAAVVQMTSTPLDPADNLARIETWLAHAADEGARLVVLPECIVTGYFLSGPEAEAIAEPIPGLRTERLQRACARHGLSAVVGLIERGPDGACYNAAVLAGPEGILAVYRKTHLLCLGVDRYLKRGERLHPNVSAGGRTEIRARWPRSPRSRHTSWGGPARRPGWSNGLAGWAVRRCRRRS